MKANRMVLVAALVAGAAGFSAIAPLAFAAGTTPTLKVAQKAPYGKYLTGANGKSVYRWMGDSKMMSHCTGQCASVWPPVTVTGKPVAGPGIDTAKLSTITRTDGARQLTYAGWPLYYFSADKSAGATNGENSDGFGHKWDLMSPSGHAIMGKADPKTASGGGSW